MYFTDSHEWIEVKEGVGIVGITDHAQHELGEVVYLELPEVGKKVRAGEEVVVLESTKAAADIYSPVSGEILAVNSGLKESTSKINQAAESEGWLFQIKLADSKELQNLLKKEEYLKLIKG